VLRETFCNYIWPERDNKNAVVIYPATGKGLTRKKTKCPEVRKFSRSSAI